MDPYVDYIIKGALPIDEKEAWKIKQFAPYYVYMDGRLYKRSSSLLLLQCLKLSKANYALHEVHEGICENHSESRSLAYKIIRQEYY